VVLVSPDGVAPSRMVGVSASVNLPLHHKVQKFSSGTSSPGWSWKKGRKTVVVWCGWGYNSNEPCTRWGAHWRHLANTIEPSMCGGDAALCQFTLGTCL